MFAYLVSGRGQSSESSPTDSGEKTVSDLSSMTGGGDMLSGLGGLAGGGSSSSVPSSALGGRGGAGRSSSNIVCTGDNTVVILGCALIRTGSCAHTLSGGADDGAEGGSEGGEVESMSGEIPFSGALS